MKTLGFLALLVGFAALSVPSAYAQTSQRVTPAQEGGTRSVLVSIVIPPVANAPFTATVTTVWTTYMADGTIATIKNHRTIARDSAGRIFQERRFFSPNGDKRETAISQLEFSDPVLHQEYFCHPEVHACEIYGYFAAGSPVEAADAVSRAGANGVKIEDLGHDTIAGLDTVGTRETTTIAPGTLGNDQGLSAVRDLWYSAQLGFDLMLNRNDPRTGTANIRVTEIRLGEPDVKLFDPPSDYTVVDARKPAASLAN